MRIARMMQLWFSSSPIQYVRLVCKAKATPRLVVYALLKLRAAGRPTKFAIACSSSTWAVNVPSMKRTAPGPTP
jgi:hypothetical protein